MDEERRNDSNWEDKTIPLEEEQTIPLRENRGFSNQVRKPKLKHSQGSNARSSYNQAQGNQPLYGQAQNSQSWGNPHSQNPYQQGGQNPYGGNNNPYQQGNQNPYNQQPYPPVGQNPYSQQRNQNPYNQQPYPQGDFNAYGPQSYPQGNPNGYGQQPYPQRNPNKYGQQSYPQRDSNVYGQQSNSQGEPSSYNQPSYVQTPVKVRSKMPFIIAGALIVILFLGGLAIGLISSNKSGTQANKNSQNAEQGDSSKILVQNGDFDTVVTVKSKDVDNIKLFKEPGGKKKAGKVQEGVPCALLQEKTVDGEKWAKIDFCNRQGWCRMDRLRTISGEACYFYVKENSNENTVFVNERAIKLHTGAGQDTDIAATDVKYGTELTISKVEDGWGRTNYQNKECWIDMNVVGFYTSKYWQVERCDGSKNGIKLRKSSTEDSEQLTTVPLCTKFQSSDCRNGWARFTYGGKTGWLKLHYATPCGSSKGLSFSEDENNF